MREWEFHEKLLEILQQIMDEIRKLNPINLAENSEEYIQEISGCRWCGYGMGHHRECPRFNNQS